MSASIRTVRSTSVEYLNIDISASVDLVSQPVAFALGGAEWLDAEWVGDIGQERTARLLLTADNMPAKGGWYQVLVRVTDNPEIPVFEAGILEVK